MDKFYIRGENTLEGCLDISTSKNAVLPILAASILCDETVVIHKFPNYEDTKNMLQIIQSLGAKVKHENSTVIIKGETFDKFEIPQTLASLLRSSIFSLGAILGRFKKARVAYPGGCAIGARPIDLHIKGLEALNVKITDKHGYLNCDASNMRGGHVNLDFPSVGATENIMLASVLIKGKTQISNAAKEPEIIDLANFLNKMGAKVSGAGSSTIEIEGVASLNGCEYTPMTDRIITGTYLIAGAMCGGNITLNTKNAQHLTSLISKLKNNGCKVYSNNDKIQLLCDKRPKAIVKIETMPYPGFATDLQAQTTALLSICKGTSIIVENLFESRFKHVPELIKMGADIVINDRTAVVKGVPMLYGAEVTANELRGGAALVLAGLVAKGYTTVNNIHHIDRGYEHIEKDLKKLGANIERIIEK